LASTTTTTEDFMRSILLATALIMTACTTADDAADDAATDGPDAGPVDVDAPTSSLRACATWDDCLGDPLPDGRRLDIGECCAVNAHVCVIGRMTGGEGNNPSNPYPGDPHGGVCLADTTALPLPAASCAIHQPADSEPMPACATDADCRVVDATTGNVTLDGCCAVDVGRCVRGSEYDYYGRPAVCAVRTDFAAPEDLCQ
jgi:hypothetical protein